MSAVQAENDRLALDARQVAHRLGLSRRTVESLVSRGEIPHARVGRRVLFPLAELREWIAARTVGGARP